VHVVYPAVIAALLFAIGVYGVLARRNTILVLMSVELMLNAVNLNLVAFDGWLRDTLHSGQALTLFVIVIAAAEVGLGLAIILTVFRTRRTVDLDELRDLAETDPSPAQPATPATATPGTATPGTAGQDAVNGPDTGGPAGEPTPRISAPSPSAPILAGRADRPARPGTGRGEHRHAGRAADDPGDDVEAAP
jgi:NADH-quinone oxidoreductase subunit K